MQIYSNTLRNVGTSYDDNGNSFAVTWEFASSTGKLRANAQHLPATLNGGSYGNVFVSSKIQFSSLNGSLTVAGRLGSYSGGIPAAGYAAELLSSGQVKLWRLSDWAQRNGKAIAGTSTISGLQAGQWVTLGLRLNGSTLSVEIDGVTRITAYGIYNLFAYLSRSVKFICIEWNF